MCMSMRLAVSSYIEASCLMLVFLIIRPSCPESEARDNDSRACRLIIDG